jgi:hypothetical protein
MRRILIAAVFGLTCACVATEAQAQFSFGYMDKNWGISVGPSAGYGLGYGAYPYGANPYGAYGWGNNGPRYHVNINPNYAPGPNYAPAPSYRYRSSPSYVRSSVAPTPRPQPVGDGLPIKIVCPDDLGAELTYTLNEHEYTIKPGESQTLVNNRQWVITFDRGADYGTAQYSMSAGTYTFALTKKGWDIYHDADVSKLTKKPTDKSTAAKNSLPIEKK